MATLFELILIANDVYNDDPITVSADGYYNPQSSPESAGNPLMNWVGLPSRNETAEYAKQKELVNIDSFFARLYANIHTGETVIAFRGTEVGKNISKISTAEDFAADVQIGILGEISSQDIDALLFFQWAKNYLNTQMHYNFYRFPILTGHSLGGYLAQLIASKYPGTITITFNAPGLTSLINPIMNINPSYARLEETLANGNTFARAFFSREITPSHLYANDIHDFNISYDAIHKVGTQVGTVYTLSGSDRSCNIHVTASCLYQGHEMDEFITAAQKDANLANLNFSY